MSDGRASSIRRVGTIEIVAVFGILVVVAAAAIWLIGQAIPLGWDESVYASRSRALITDIPSSTWAIYRAPGLPVIGLLGGAFGFTDANLRAVALVLNLGTLALAWAFARTLWGPVAAIVALLTIAGSPVVIAQIALFHTDLSSVGLLLALMLLVWHEFEHRLEPSRLLIAAAPLAAFAFYLRYGSILPIAGIGITAVLLWHRSMLRNRGLVGLTVALAALLFVPHILESISHTGSPVGIITSAGEQVDTWEPSATAARYLGWLPAQLAHRLGFVVMLAGVAHACITAIDTIRRRELGPVARRYLWLFAPAGVTTVGLILLSHPEERYVLFPVGLAIIAGGGAISAAVAWLRDRPGLAGRQNIVDGAVVVGILLIAVIVGSVGARRLVVLEREGEEWRWLPAVGQAIDADADGSCSAVTSVPPMIEWYSRCAARPFTTSGAEALAAGVIDDATFIVLSPIDERRASARTIARYRELTEPTIVVSIPVNGAQPGVEVYRLSP